MKPEIIFKYNDNKHGVDKVDPILSYNSYSRKNYKQWETILFYIFDITIMNASIVYFNGNSASKNHPKYYHSVHKLVSYLCTNTETEKFFWITTPEKNFWFRKHFWPKTLILWNPENPDTFPQPCNHCSKTLPNKKNLLFFL